MLAIEDFFLNRLMGHLLSRAAVTIAACVAGPQVYSALAVAGIQLTIDPATLTAAMTVGAHWAFDAFKAWRHSTPIGGALNVAAAQAAAPDIVIGGLRP